MKSIVLALVMAAGISTQASLLTLTAGNKSIQGVTLNQTAQASVQGADPMTLVGAGLRTKTVVILPVNVYVAELFASAPAKYTRDTNALPSLQQSTTTAVRLTFLRGVDAATVASSYKDALTANNVNLNDPAINSFLNTVSKGGNAAQGKSFIMLMVKNASGGTDLYYEDTNGQDSQISGPAAFQQEILSIWLGNPADSGLKTLKSSLLQPVY